MDEKCRQCGADIPEDEAFCRNCGWKKQGIEESPAEPAQDAAEQDIALEQTLDAMKAEAQEETAVGDENPKPDHEETAGKKKCKWWYIAIPAALVIAILAAVLWTPLSVYLAPEVALIRAAANTMEDINCRSEGTPFAMMSELSESSKKSTTTMSMILYEPSAGEMELEMISQADSDTRQSLTTINLYADVLQMEIGMDLYIDPDKAGVRIEPLTGEEYYGIIYETFGDGVRENDFLYDAIGEDTLQSVEMILEMLDRQLSMEPLTEAQVKESSEAYGKVFENFIRNQELEVNRAELDLDGKQRNCYALTLNISEKDFGVLLEALVHTAQDDPVMEYYLNQSGMNEEMQDAFLETMLENAKEAQEAGEGSYTLVFYLYDNRLVQMECTYEDGDRCSTATVIFGANPVDSDMIFRAANTEGESEERCELILSTHKDGSVVNEELTITTASGEERSTLAASYEWDPDSGKLLISAGADEESLTLEAELHQEEDGYSFAIPKFGEYILDMAGEPYSDTELECSIEVSVQAGAEIQEPEILDITTLSKYDFLGILMTLA